MTEAAEKLLNFWQHHCPPSLPETTDLIVKHPDVLRSWLLLHMSQAPLGPDSLEIARNGPTPLPLHAHHFTHILSSIRPLLVELYSENFTPNLNASQEWQNLHRLTRVIPAEELYAQIQGIIAQKAQAFIRGLLHYHGFPYHRHESADAHITWTCGSAKLHDYGAPNLHAPRIFLIPSMINKPYILDLYDDQSLIQFLKSKGHHVFMLEWGAPQSEQDFSLDDYFHKRLLPAFHHVTQDGQHTINILGYCMGGIFALALGQFYPIQKSVLIAPPWDFHAVPDPRRTFHTLLHELLLPFLEAYNSLPGQVIQALFYTLNPEGMFEKFERFIAMDTHDQKQFFVALEDWANDNVDLAKITAHQILKEWFQDNTLVYGTFNLGLGAVKPADNKTPTLIITGSRDRVVPHAMTHALTHSLPYQSSHHFDTGHTGLVVGELAKKSIWPLIDNWLQKK